MDLHSFKNVAIAALLGLTLGCGKKTQTVDPVTPAPESPSATGPVQKSKIDIRLLRVTPYFDRFLNGSTPHVSELTPENWLAQPVQTPEYGQMLPQGAAIQLVAVGGV